MHVHAKGVTCTLFFNELLKDTIHQVVNKYFVMNKEWVQISSLCFLFLQMDSNSTFLDLQFTLCSFTTKTTVTGCRH